MTPFRFRLARVLSWYRKQCDLEESRLHACSAAVLEVAAEIVRIQTARAAIERETVHSPSARAGDLIAMERYRQRTKRDELRLEAEFHKRQSALAAQRAALEAARLRFRLIGKLRDRRISEYSVAADRELEELAADAFRAVSFRQTQSVQ
jgi:parvulin-like peptidyl-prolyl isomerase